MSDRRSFAVFGFDSTHDALSAETVLLDAAEDVVLIPTPRKLGTLCGFAVRVPAERRAHALAHLARSGIVPNGTIEIEDRA